ncbi:uncharacterized protein LOC124912988 [Impatiens glandulifera]|uniref:uncharacterized protein LOC124912988 n=1 Tax=Impatiens glandulifera TaxID=253017 RepID=UPI001FB1A1A5|nr:uncharacterized protein LOC124912988 [Impatiens glandulifera]
MKRRFEARRERSVRPRWKIASMKGLTTNQTSSATTPGISKDTARAKKVKFKSSRWEHGETSSHEREAPKTSEYAYFRKFKNNADSEDMNNYQELRFSTHVEKVRPINYNCSPSSPAVTTTMARGLHN